MPPRVPSLRSFALGMILLAGLAEHRAFAQDGSLWTRDTLTGDWGGARTQGSDRGIDLSLDYTSDVFGNLTGGLETGTTYEDLFEFAVDADFEKLIGWKGGSGHISLFRIDDSGMNAGDLTGSISDPSSIDALPTFRLFTLYVEQDLWHAGSVRVGQIAADDEFFISDTSADLINGAFGWPNILDDNLPGGGPAYPLATPGARLELIPSEEVKMLAAVFSGNPAGNCPADEDPEICNRHGTTFSFSGGALFMGEVQYRPGAGAAGQDDGQDEGNGAPRPIYRLGGWYLTGDKPDVALGRDPNGQIVSLASDPSDPVEHDGDWGIYGIVDQPVWHNDRTSIALFLRVAAAPADRNLVSFYIDSGFGITGLLGARPDDMLVFGASYTDISSDASALDRATRRATGTNLPIRNYETALELTYIVQMAPWWTLQPDIQYIIHPGGNVPDPNNPDEAVKDAFLLGLRTTVTF